MDKPRLAELVRNDFRTLDALASKDLLPVLASVDPARLVARHIQLRFRKFCSCKPRLVGFGRFRAVAEAGGLPGSWMLVVSSASLVGPLCSVVPQSGWCLQLNRAPDRSVKTVYVQIP
jgi:hypothetical protein